MAIVKKYPVIVERVEERITGIYTVSFSCAKKFNFNPGQFLHLALDAYDPSMQWPDSRCFSMQSNPDDALVTITFSVKGNFTRRMAEELKPGKEVWLKLPYGTLFDRGHSQAQCVFISGGTGITPYLSLFTHSSFAEYKQPVLYAGFRNKACNIFESELNTAIQINSGLRYCPVYEDTDGLIPVEEVYLQYPGAVFFISGPPIMIKNFKAKFLQLGLPEGNIMIDDWE
ncbi:MAG: FAD-dependent oxidoreductase [Ignavibacteria bacterium]|nr:FAD-dependent oxidoreductase [Ignavibacteria bacterium]